MGGHLTGEELATIMSDALGRDGRVRARHNQGVCLPRFPRAQELANQFQYLDEGTETFVKEGSVAETRSFNPRPARLHHLAQGQRKPYSFSLTSLNTQATRERQVSDADYARPTGLAENGRNPSGHSGVVKVSQS
jgi:hypothetical protein